MDYNLRFHIADTTPTTSIVMFSTLDSINPVTISIPGATAVVGVITDIHASGDYIGTGKITVTGLSASTKYPFVLTQGSERYDGSITTDHATQEEDYSFLMMTCTNHQFAFSNVFNAVANEIRNNGVSTLFHIDDFGYVDTMDLFNLNNLLDATGLPQDTGLVRDYATGWAAILGHESKYACYTDEDYQYCLRNASWYLSGGDHMFEKNHCRGMIGNGDYSGCNRGAGAVVPFLEENALTAWHAFIGDGNPPTLGSGTDLNWGKQIGPVRFCMFDTNKYSQPFDGVDKTKDYFGAAQLAQNMTYLDVNDVPIKCALMETGFSRAGQPWREWFTTECDAWHTNDLVGNNLDSTSGWFFSLIGDNHTVHAASLDSGTGTGFWWFCAGTTGGSAATNWVNTWALPIQTGNKTGRTRYFRHKENKTKNIAAYLKVTVHASESPKRIVCEAKDINGSVIYSYEMTTVSGNDNQWVNTKSQKLGF